MTPERDPIEAAKDLDATLDCFFANRYETHDLIRIGGKSLVEDERYMANAMLGLRLALGYPQAETVGEERCVSCHKIMADESSVFEDETVCQKCGDES